MPSKKQWHYCALGTGMRRRDFIVATLCSAAAVPFSALAQSTERVRLVGIVNVLSLDDPEAQVRLTIFKNALEQLGWEVGRNLKIETRQIGGDIDRIRRYAAEIVALAPDVILAVGSIAVGALQMLLIRSAQASCRTWRILEAISRASRISSIA